MQDEVELKILLKAEIADSQHFLARELGYSVGKVNYILKAFIENGLVKVESFAASKNKKQHCYLLTPYRIKAKIELTEKFIQRKNTYM
ncbi:MAG: winged helix-turn-helix transcriptional regulator [Campylobacteraceae bacterium]|jgi:predicted transcriptional regulator|nr:winged helix-turn-helix transcriptional regulator [Campylobacteraceae bacterium]